ncbi:MAG: phosphoribosylglycinamide formyltransferase [Candidatus ainarchaeum sp.]|nr:phosphoribosylglycinamide formyltransferase [Candidatus ainarchaeum sp.]
MQLVIGILASTNATDLQAVIDAIAEKKLSAEIACLISNKADAFALERAKKHNIEAIFLNPKDFKSMEEFDLRLVKELQKRRVGLVLLIGYNKILAPVFIDAFKNRAMNIHPSLLPSFKGWDRNVHRDILDFGSKITGCTLHFVTEEADAGPIIIQTPVPIAEDETVDSLKEKVQKAEGEAIIRGIKLFSEGKIRIEGNKAKILN